MGGEHFVIEFDNDAKSFFPGQSVTGRVVISNDSSKTCQGLKIIFTGEALVHWTEETESTVNGNKTRTTHNIDDKDTFFDYKTYLLGDDRDDVTIPAGKNEYPFQFALPSNLPSSFVGEYGSVKYEVNATLKRSWKFDLTAKKVFTVNALADLNKNPKASVPTELKKHKNLCCLCCTSGPIGVLMKLPKSGFVPGEFIPITAEITNMSSRNLTGASLQFSQKTTFYAKGKTRSGSKVLSEVKRPGVPPGETEIWQGNLIQVPSVPPTKLGGCRIIDVQYELKVEISVAGPSLNLTGVVPIEIGTIPLQGTFDNLPPGGGTAINANNGKNDAKNINPNKPNMNTERLSELEEAIMQMQVKDAFVSPNQFIPTTNSKNAGPNLAPSLPSASKDEEFLPSYVNYGWKLNN